MDSNLLFLQKTYTMTTSDLDQYDRLSPAAIFDFFQDIAGRHAEMLGIGFHPLLEKGYYWVLTRNVYEIVHPLTSYDDLVVSTWPHKPSSFDFTREYEIHDSKGQLLVKGLSKWLILSKDTHQIQRSRVVSYGTGKHLERRNFNTSLDKLENYDLLKAPSIYQTKITHSQIDHNGHMNNAEYAVEIFNALAPNKKQIIQRFEINYLGEMFIGDTLSIHSKDFGDFIAVEGYRGDEIKVRAKVHLA